MIGASRQKYSVVSWKRSALCVACSRVVPSSRLRGESGDARAGVGGDAHLPNSHGGGPERHSGGSGGEDAALQAGGRDLQAHGPGGGHVWLRRMEHAMDVERHRVERDAGLFVCIMNSGCGSETGR